MISSLATNLHDFPVRCLMLVLPAAVTVSATSEINNKIIRVHGAFICTVVQKLFDRKYFIYN